MGHHGRWGFEFQKLKREKAPRGGQAWSDDEVSLLIKEYHQGLQPEDMAGSHQRTAAACVSKLVHVGILIPDGGAYWERPAKPYVTVRQMMNMAEQKMPKD
jgi:hypothetical protein